MGTFDCYLLRQYLRVFLASFISLLGLFVVADFVSNLSRFLDHGGDQVLELLGSYYSARVPWFFDLSSRVVAVIAAVMTIAWLRRHNEWTAIMAGGIPPWRVVKPLVIATVVISMIAAVNRELIVPRCRALLCHEAEDLISDRADPMQPRFDNETNVILSGDALYAKDRRISSIRLRLPQTWHNIGRQIAASNAYYQEANADHPAGYLLVETTDHERIAQTDSLAHQHRWLVLSPKDTPWLKPNECFLVSNLSFEQLHRGQKWQQCSSTTELLAGLRNPSLDFGDDVRVLVHGRMVQPILDVCLLFLALPLAVSGEGRNVFLAAGKCLLAVAGFTILGLTCQGLGIHGLLSPIQAAWLPLIILIPTAAAMFAPFADGRPSRPAASPVPA
ncbi:MAG: LptF/LptG family permease [Pirellulaceae bacterium]|nr:LptF/LptG family permease [Planctomycetales bacterium]